MKTETIAPQFPIKPFVPLAAVPAQAAGRRLTLALMSIEFFGLGMLTAALGPALAGLARHTGSNLAAMGSLFTALFLGALAAQAIAGPTRDRLGPRPVLLVGLALIGGGTLGLTTVPWLWLALVFTFVAGLGHGAVDVVTSVTVAELFPERRAMALNLVNVFFGLGAFAGPLAAGLTLRAWDTALPGLWVGGGMLLLMIPLIARWATLVKPAPQAGQPAGGGQGLLRSPLLWTIGLLLLVYVGIENGTGGWAPTYLERVTGMAAAQAALITSGFWMALTAGRIFATLLGARLSSAALLASSLVTAALGSGLLAAGAASPDPGLSAGLSVAGILLLGLGFGPVFPTVIALVTAAFPGAAGTAAGAVVALGSLGGMLLPAAQGWVLARSGPAGSLAITLAATLGMLVLYAAYRRLSKP